MSRVRPVNGDTIPWQHGEESERAFWRDYVTALRSLRIVDPACGSGAFLVAAFDLLAREYRPAIEHLAALGGKVDFDPFDEIVTRNLYGVDLNAESVEITRLALWLKTARSRHRLQSLDATIMVGDSLIEDAAFTARPFDWHAAFPEVFAEGGFDVVIGNPPYVRMELIKQVKPYLEQHFSVADDRTDLYAYFFERGVALLKEGGRLGFISSSTFFRTGSGEKLRALLGAHAIETVVDFGDLQLFEGVTTYPAIVTLKKGGAADDGTLAFLNVETVPGDLDVAFAAAARPMLRARLGRGSWQFEDDTLAALRDKLASGRPTLREVYGSPLYGIKTGLNDAFIIDTATRDRLVAQDARSAELLVPFLRGENIRRWRVEPDGLFLVNIPKGQVDIDAYPAIRDWLLPFRPALEARATRQEWFELQQAQLAYQPRFQAPKIIYGHFARNRMFAFDAEGFFSNDKSYFIPNATFDLLALLNSAPAWFVIAGLAPAVRGGFHEMRVQYLEQVPIPDLTGAAKMRLESLGARCVALARQQFNIDAAVRHRIQADLGSGSTTWSRRLEAWWTLDFAALRDELKRVFHADIPVRQRAEWEAYLAGQGEAVRAEAAAIAEAERAIDAIVDGAFGLTPLEAARLGAAVA